MSEDTPPRGTWGYSPSESEDGWLFSIYAADADEAQEWRDEIQSLAGSRLERDANFLYVIVGEDDLDEALEELAAAGFDCEEQG